MRSQPRSRPNSPDGSSATFPPRAPALLETTHIRRAELQAKIRRPAEISSAKTKRVQAARKHTPPDVRVCRALLLHHEHCTKPVRAAEIGRAVEIAIVIFDDPG